MIKVRDSYRIRRYNYLVDNYNNKPTKSVFPCGFYDYHSTYMRDADYCRECKYNIGKGKDVVCFGFMGICDVTTLEFALHWKDTLISLSRTLRSFGKPPSCVKNKEHSDE